MCGLFASLAGLSFIAIRRIGSIALLKYDKFPGTDRRIACVHGCLVRTVGDDRVLAGMELCQGMAAGALQRPVSRREYLCCAAAACPWSGDFQSDLSGSLGIVGKLEFDGDV
jgi:hypothetical protein